MAEWVNQDLIKSARKADLYGFLRRHHAGDIEIEGNSLRLRDNHSLTLKEGYSGWKDWATDESGNAIDLLTGYLGYEFPDAVMALCADMGIVGMDAPQGAPRIPQQVESRPQAPSVRTRNPFVLPAPQQGQYKQLYAYLTQSRKIPLAMVQRLVDDGILYQEANHAYIVFINPDRTFAELRGTNTFKPFHQVMFSDNQAFWWFQSDKAISKDTVAFICESAIDAISLYLLQMDRVPELENGLYCSIAGVANQRRIDYIKQSMAGADLRTVIAVDNDDAGEKCRQRNKDCPCLIPIGKDWNEDWQARMAKVG